MPKYNRTVAAITAELVEPYEPRHSPEYITDSGRVPVMLAGPVAAGSPYAGQHRPEVVAARLTTRRPAAAITAAPHVRTAAYAGESS